jgi:hypothetical protein
MTNPTKLPAPKLENETVVQAALTYARRCTKLCPPEVIKTEQVVYGKTVRMCREHSESAIKLLFTMYQVASHAIYPTGCRSLSGYKVPMFKDKYYLCTTCTSINMFDTFATIKSHCDGHRKAVIRVQKRKGL